MPAISKMDPLLLKTKPFSHSDSGSGLTYLSRVENSCKTSEGLWKPRKVGREELSEIQQMKMQGPEPSEGYPHAPGLVRADLPESSSVEKDLGAKSQKCSQESQKHPGVH